MRKTTRRLSALGATALMLLCCLSVLGVPASADIFEWEYIDPNNPNLGKQESTVLVPQGSGIIVGSPTSLLGRNLTKGYFFRANMRQFNVSTTDLDDAYLAEADMYSLQADGLQARRADMSSANLEMASFVGADLSYADLTNANLSNANLTGAGFGGVTFDGVDLSNTLVKDANLSGDSLTKNQFYSTASYQAKDLGSIGLFVRDLSGWDFSEQSMVRALFGGSDVSNANFMGADLTLARIGKQFDSYQSTNFAEANLTGLRMESRSEWRMANFNRANLTDAEIGNSSFIDSTFEDAIIRGADLTLLFSQGFTRENLYSTASYKSGELSGVVLDENDLSGVLFNGVNLSNAQLWQVNLEDADFRNANLQSAALRGNFNQADFRGANLANSRFSGDTFVGTQFQGADLTGAIFFIADLKEADLTDAIIYGTDFGDSQEANITEAQLRSTASYQAGNLGPIKIRGDFRDWDFSNQDLSGARFGSDSQLQGVNWTGAVLNETFFRGADLRNTDFRNVDVRHAEFFSSDLQGADFRGNDLTGIRLEGSLVNAKLDGVNLSGFVEADLTNASFVGADLRNSSFNSRSNFQNTDFTDADIRHAGFRYAIGEGFTLATLQSTRSYKDRDLTGVYLDGNDLTGLDLSNFELTDADLNRADLTDVSFVGANLSNVEFQFATLTGADFTDATIENAKFWYASKNGFTAQQLYSTASYRRGNLRGIVFADNDVSGWDFSNIDLSGADFSSTNTAGADFTGATIAGADFSTRFISSAVAISREQLSSTSSYQQKELPGVGLRHADLTGLDLSEQNLEGANFGEANLSGVDFSGAHVLGASFSSRGTEGISAEQFYSTASYQRGDLRGVVLSNTDLSGWVFDNQNLVGAVFDSCGFGSGASSFVQADLRGASFRHVSLANADTTNTIHPDGSLHGLSLSRRGYIEIHNYRPVFPLEGDPIGILVDTQFQLVRGSTLKLAFDAEDWHSTISFVEGTTTWLDATLDLTFVEGVDPATQVGRTFNLFDWAGVTLRREFTLASDPSLIWDTSSLYTTGTIQLLAVVPEPSTVVLALSMAVVGMGYLRRT